MWNGKLKAVTFSYDDAVTQDKRLVEIFNKYGLKATFNINSGLFGAKRELTSKGKTIAVERFKASEIKEMYQGHEVGAHSLTHPYLTKLEDDEIIRQIEEDRKNLEAIMRYDVRTLAYPMGAVDDRVANILKEHTRIKLARTTVSTHNFDLQQDLYKFNPTVFHKETEK